MVIRHGVYGILIENNSVGDTKVLMVKTQSGPLSIWNFPGGGIDAGENEEQALLRECREEIGAAVTVHECLYAPEKLFVHPALGYQSVMRYYRIALVSGSQIDYAVHGAQWFALEALPFEAMLSVDQEMARLFF
jgi:8-oxo-dGTP diphosphatase